MLFVLTGDVQTGKTRWLHDLVEEIASRGVLCEGVLAPGVWRKRTAREMAELSAGASAGASTAAGLGSASPYEKLGIENRLLPDGPTIVFGRRRDLAGEGGFPARSQSGRAQLGWAISDEAIRCVNDHFDRLSARGDDVVSPDEKHRLPFDDEGRKRAFSSPAAFLVVDELGILELVRGGGLTSALRALEAGPTERHPHALAVVRSRLVEDAREKLEPVWGPLSAIGPDDGGRAAVLSALGLL